MRRFSTSIRTRRTRCHVRPRLRTSRSSSANNSPNARPSGSPCCAANSSRSAMRYPRLLRVSAIGLLSSVEVDIGGFDDPDTLVIDLRHAMYEHGLIAPSVTCCGHADGRLLPGPRRVRGQRRRRCPCSTGRLGTCPRRRFTGYRRHLEAATRSTSRRRWDVNDGNGSRIDSARESSTPVIDTRAHELVIDQITFGIRSGAYQHRGAASLHLRARAPVQRQQAYVGEASASCLRTESSQVRAGSPAASPSGATTYQRRSSGSSPSVA